jgi:small-conductance mechanosensitive channel
MIPTPNQIITAILIFVGAYIAAVVVMFLLRRSNFITSRTSTTLDDTIVRAIGRPVYLIFLVSGAILALRHLYPDLGYRSYGYKEFSVVVLGLLVTYALNRLVNNVVRWYEMDRAPNQGSHGQVFGFVGTMISVVLWGLALLLLMKYFGVDVSAMLAGLGIAGVAVAFALQNTLSGLFSALYLAVDKPVRPGDFVQLDDGTEGVVRDVTMRSTRIRTRSNNIVIVPNTRLADMVITNYYLPEKAVRAQVNFAVAYDSDLDQVEKVTKEVARKVVGKHANGDVGEPVVRYREFGDSAITADVIVRVDNFDDQMVVVHELVQAMNTRFAKEGISMPYPQRDVHLIKDHSSE